MKAAAGQDVARDCEQQKNPEVASEASRWPATLTGLSVALLVCGCSTFNRDWRAAANQPVATNSMEGRWEGQWLSHVNGHTGNLRCLLSHESDTRLLARFRASYWKIFRFSYSVPLQVRGGDGGWEFSGEENLGKLAGGVYRYEGRVTPTNFHSTYTSKHDHGVFEMSRPQ